MPEVLLATRSAGKLREIRELTADWDSAGATGPLIWRSLDEFPDVPEADEPGRSFHENAVHKATYYSIQTGLPALADDSGLEVDALGWRPGVDSAIFAGTPRDDLANNRKLVELLREAPTEGRIARYRCVLVLARRGRVLGSAEGVSEGIITLTPRGAGGFGYDSLFLVPELGRTFAELSTAEKSARSHRGRALRLLLPRLAALLALP